VAGRAQIKANLPVILAALREAAGPGVPIIGMNYYDAFLVVWFGDPAALQAEALGAVDFNTMLASLYTAAGDPVADVATAFSTTDFTLVGGIPLDVQRICQWTWMCAPPARAGYPSGHRWLRCDRTGVREGPALELPGAARGNDSSSTGTKVIPAPPACVSLNFGAYLAQRPASRRPCLTQKRSRVQPAGVRPTISAGARAG
jgi:hypothetical protein